MKPKLLISTFALLTALWISSVAAQESDEKIADKEPDAAKVQILLDQANFSPGSIDNIWGEEDSRTHRALAAFQRANRLDATGKPDEKTLDALRAAAKSPEPFTTSEIKQSDVGGPFADSIPQDDWKKMAEMDGLHYTSELELLAEKFHSAPEYLKQLNPGTSFRAGEKIKVPNIEPFELPSKDDAERIAKSSADVLEVIVSEPDKSLTVNGSDGKVLYYAPITPGSESLPIPSGTFEVEAFDVMPVYYFDPEIIKEADVEEKLEVPSGPNNPVGVVWIDLSKEHYGIHGTPEPEKIGYTTSHGCVRLTNWDAIEVAKLLERGAKINFVRSGSAAPTEAADPGSTGPSARSGTRE